ncbi:peptidoglycan-binding domain-containing protein [Anaerocolumna sp. MB42-C2]|uniref:peptidoglycan-binding domain-containing protein n=1 Tax=Anaerocolumna sp. MB42-C2 TaxID=3070997 RepID=UPI0027DFE140|nr:peptidoglycan-binding domain-containing protein [Anaerocolumna sp. MB42-C2]WMJ86631.1 peptidoglycan-binding domain-containing protein [Anaerocolumna sp. MB42-C2]
MYINNRIYPTQERRKYYGILQVQVVCELGSRPVENAEIQIFHKYNPNTVIDILSTDSSGKTIEIELPAPPIEYSMEPTNYQPYSEYMLVISAPGLQTVEIDSAQILPYVKTIQPVRMPLKDANTDISKLITIGPNFLFGNYPPKIYEEEVKTHIEAQVNKSVVIPEFIIVHNGIPTDLTARNYKIEYREYIKNVVSSQIYATWPHETIYANILTRLSFSLNRVFTDWYHRQGYDFDLTSSTAFDQIWIYGRNIDNNISLAVDYVFNYFLSLPDVNQPILTQACIGKSVTCQNMISLWGSKFLGDQGYKAIDILHTYYNESMYINYTNNITGIQVWPDVILSEGSNSDAVKLMQQNLHVIARAYDELPLLEADGIFNPKTQSAVAAFQKVFNLPVTGTINAVTWYKIEQIYQRLTRIFEFCK